jgi:hypothetical protein
MMLGLSSAMWTTSASATESKPEWVRKISGEEKLLKAGESEAFLIGKNWKPWVFKQTTGAGITVECNNGKFASGFGESLITGPRGLQAGPILFETCKVTAPTGDVGCEVKSPGFPNGQIRTQALGFSAEEALEGSTTTPYVRWRPESTREEIVTIELSGLSCTDRGSYEIAGLLVAKIETSALSLVHIWEFTQNTGTRLKIGGVEATLSGKVGVSLKSGNEWGDK